MGKELLGSGIALMLGITASLGAMNTQATAAESTVFNLRGSVLPSNSIAKSPETRRPVKLASLGHDKTANGETITDAIPGALPRLNFANFRYSFEPARGHKKSAGMGNRRGKSSAGHVKLTSLNHSYVPRGKSHRNEFRKVARGLIKWKAYPGCVPAPLKKVLVKLSKKFGGITVNSTHRSHRYNRKIGGAKHSYHLSCQAVDFRLHGRYRRAALAYLKKQPQIGGLKHYGGGLFHIDIGRRRTW